MKLLLINSSDKNSFAAFWNSGKAEISYSSEFKNKEEKYFKEPDNLIKCIYKISQNNDLKSAEAIAVNTGPGSFTGLRVGLAIAKGIAFLSNIKIIPINNFELLINRFYEYEKNGRTKFCVLIESKHPEYYYGILNNKKIEQTGVTNIEELTEIIDKETIIAGDFDDETELKHSYFRIINIKNQRSEFEAMLEIAINSFKLNKTENPSAIIPYYIKDFQIKNFRKNNI